MAHNVSAARRGQPALYGRTTQNVAPIKPSPNYIAWRGNRITWRGNKLTWRGV